MSSGRRTAKKPIQNEGLCLGRDSQEERRSHPGKEGKMKSRLCTIALFAAAVVCPVQGAGIPFIVDQSNTPSDLSGPFDPIVRNGPLGQEFTPALSSLDVVEVFTAVPGQI